MCSITTEYRYQRKQRNNDSKMYIHVFYSQNCKNFTGQLVRFVYNQEFLCEYNFRNSVFFKLNMILRCFM